MPNLPRTRRRTIQVDAGFLPPPATKLIVTQYLEASQDPPFWAWIVVGAFYDGDDRVIWSTEVFAAHLDIQFESDDEGDEPRAPEGSDSSSGHSSDLGEPAGESPAAAQQQAQQRAHQAYLQPPDVHYINPPAFWDPTRQGPVPGYWQASFDQSSRRWVHTWQPLC